MNLIKLWLAQRLVNRTKAVTYSLDELERKHVDNSLPFTNDSSFFYGGDNFGNSFICRMAFRGKNRRPEGWFDFFLLEKGFIGLKGLPGQENAGFQLGELKWETLELGKRWLITYNGDLEDANKVKYKSRVELEFSSDRPLHDFTQSSDKKLIAKAIASEKWNKTFFEKLKELFNSSIEKIVDMVQPEKDKFAGQAKDMAAGAVLISAIASATVGLMIFLPKIIN